MIASITRTRANRLAKMSDVATITIRLKIAGPTTEEIVCLASNPFYVPDANRVQTDRRFKRFDDLITEIKRGDPSPEDDRPEEKNDSERKKKVVRYQISTDMPLINTTAPLN